MIQRRSMHNSNGVLHACEYPDCTEQPTKHYSVLCEDDIRVRAWLCLTHRDS